jgi:Nif-specific regulatory protein
LIEEAHGGTLFLDEVSEASPTLQAKLLRVIQERTVRRVGATAERRVDTRIVAATNRDLWREVAAGRFREDLYYRLAVFPIAIPPLRERPEDLSELLTHFLARHGPTENRPGCYLSRDALHRLEAHHWPGNIRELENEIQRALVLAEPGEALEPSHFSDRLGGIIDTVQEATRELRAGETLRETLERIEAWLIRRSLEANQQRRTQTAKKLGITREGLHKKMKRLNIL